MWRLDFYFLLSCNKIIHPETVERSSQGHLKKVNNSHAGCFTLLIKTAITAYQPLHWMWSFYLKKKEKVKKEKKRKSTDVFKQTATAG